MKRPTDDHGVEHGSASHREGPGKRGQRPGWCRVVVGAGGNIGSHLVPHLARMPEVRSLILIDHDRYEASNLQGQAIQTSDVGEWKAEVMACRARDLRDDLEVRAITDDVESVPMGWLRADSVLSCLDTRRARQHVNQLAWRMGVPWIDAGVLADGGLARVDVFLAGSQDGCLECGWSEGDYAALEVRHPCEVAPASVATGASSSLGALAASLQAIECRGLLAGEGATSRGGWQIVLDSENQRFFRTAHARNPDCRFDHAGWCIERWSGGHEGSPLADLLEYAGGLFPDAPQATAESAGQSRPRSLRVEPQRFVVSLDCRACGAAQPLARLASRLPDDARVCPRCGEDRHLAGNGLVDRLEVGGLSSEQLRRPLESFGLAGGDVVSVTAGEREAHIEIGAAGR